MKQTKIIMGMPITVMINASQSKKLFIIFKKVFDYFEDIDSKYSPYKLSSQVSKYNLCKDKFKIDPEFQKILDLADYYHRRTEGYFDIDFNGIIDPSGIVKAYAIEQACLIIKDYYDDFYLDVGGDIVVSKPTSCQEYWKIGIRDPFHLNQIVKVVKLQNGAVATSGNYIKKSHLYNPLSGTIVKDPVSLTVIGSSIIEVDVLATAAFSRGLNSIYWLEQQDFLEAYMINAKAQATYTSGFEVYI